VLYLSVQYSINYLCILEVVDQVLLEGLVTKLIPSQITSLILAYVMNCRYGIQQVASAYKP
jgi:hypothetical protein